MKISSLFCLVRRVESKEVSLKQMLRVVKDDKAKIMQTLEKLNSHKLDALNRTWERVNEYT